MAGERQHYLPQFLQRGFATKQVADDTFVWVYRKDREAYEEKTKNVGFQRKFYNQGSDTSADVAITEAETREFSVAVNMARTARFGPIPSGPFPSLFAHLEVRSRQLREVFGIAGATLIEKTLDAGMKALPGLLEKQLQNVPTELRQLLLSQLPNVESELGLVIAQIKASLPEKNRRSLKTALVQALQETVSPEARVNQYKDLNFSVVQTGTSDLILGDGAVLFHVGGEKSFKSISEKSDSIVAALLPLTPDRILVGASGDYTVDVPTLRSALACCSHEFFISNQRSENNENLASFIGSATPIMSESELDGIVNEAVASRLEG